MDSATVSLALEHWHALSTETGDSLRARGIDGKFYPAYRHILAWDVDAAIADLPGNYRSIANAIRYGLPWPVVTRRTRETTCELIAEHLRGVVYEF